MSKNNLPNIVCQFLSISYKSIRFIYHRLQEKRQFGKYELAFSPEHNKECVNILANGPSLKNEIIELKKAGLRMRESAVVNFFALSETFFELKPKYYLLADKKFFLDENQDGNYGRVFKSFNDNVDWDMNLIVPYNFRSKARQYVKNERIKIDCVSSLMYEGDENKRFKSWKSGKSVPSYVNVAIMGEYYFLQKGYSKIYLYGVDHTFLQNLAVDDDNFLCISDTHFYGTQMYRITDIIEGKEVHCKIADFVYDKYLTFKEHELMQAYSEYLGAQIINCTKCSMIDAYPRLAQIEKENKQS